MLRTWKEENFSAKITSQSGRPFAALIFKNPTKLLLLYPFWMALFPGQPG